MNAAVVDTDVVSMLFQGDSRAAKFEGHLSGRLLGISFMTFAELERWSLERKWGAVESFALSGRWSLFQHDELAERFRQQTLGSPPRPCIIKRH